MEYLINMFNIYSLCSLSLKVIRLPKTTLEVPQFNNSVPKYYATLFSDLLI